MTQLVLPRRFTQQPQQAVQVDWSNPLTRGLIHAVDGISRDAAANRFAMSSSATRSAGLGGVGADLTSAQNSQFAFNRSAITNQCTFFLFFDQVSNVSNSFIFGDVDPAGSGYNSGLYSNSSNYLFFVKNTGGAGVNAAGTTPSGAGGNLVRLAGTYDGAALALYFNGVLEGTSAQTGNVDTGAFNLSVNRWNASAGFPLRVYVGYVFNRTLSAREIKALSDNPCQLFKAPARRIWMSVSAGAPAGTAALTGAGATGATGTASSSTSIATTGNSSTGAVGAASPTTSATATGNAATSAVGAVATGITVGLTGIGATGAVGSVATGADVTAALSGVGATASVGSLGVDRSKAITGNNATAATGVVAVSRDSALTGANATAQPGSVAHDHAVGLTGIPATGAVGSVGATQAGVASLTGTPATASAGTATASLSTASTGVSGSGQVGAPAVARESAIAGAGASSTAGSVGLSVTVALSGITATASVGTVVVPSGDIVVAITGVSVIGLAGTMTGSDVIYARAPSGPGYRREFSNTTRPTQQNTTRNPR